MESSQFDLLYQGISKLQDGQTNQASFNTTQSVSLARVEEQTKALRQMLIGDSGTNGMFGNLKAQVLTLAANTEDTAKRVAHIGTTRKVVWAALLVAGGVLHVAVDVVIALYKHR
jgi:hypothetical protein